ncbi:MAG: LysM peptidoglycan-binding domain-containing protein [Desulfovibrionaceae bacterium]|nr:LysM peptidoglycan-binding domain-containing protein [Desulfovibrionaceae bacterium]MBF0512588.1 LysM peptidoglycan-binding domain-containing protein [Desulfovibrionaceae bacterium]
MKKFLVALAVCTLFASGCAKKKENSEAVNLDPELQNFEKLDIKRGRPLTEREKKVLATQTELKFDLGDQQNEEVQLFLQYFAEDKRATMEAWLQRAAPYLPYVRAALASRGLPADLIVLPFIESGYNNLAYSPAGAGGMWQFMPATGQRFNLTVDWWVDERRNPYLATMAAADYLTELNAMFGDWHLALAAYNAGENKVSRAMAATGCTNFFDLAKDPRQLKEETKHYIPKFLAVLKIFRNLDTLGFAPVKWDAGQTMEEVAVAPGTDLAAMAQACNMNWDEFHAHNAALRRQVSPADREYVVYVPKTKVELAQAYLKDPDSRPKIGYKTVLADNGDTWWKLSRRTGIPINVLRQVNGALPEDLGAGQAVLVPGDSLAADSALAQARAEERHVAADSCPPGAYRARKGDTVASLAKRFGVSEHGLRQANSLRPGANRLEAGLALQIPPKTPAAGRPAETVRAVAQQHANYIVKKGDTIEGISKHTGVNAKTLLAANGIRSAKDLEAGMKLSIPDNGAPAQEKSRREAEKVHASFQHYKVESGETLYSIARKFKVDPNQLMAWNNMNKTSQLKPGDKIKVQR